MFARKLIDFNGKCSILTVSEDILLLNEINLVFTTIV